MRWALFAVVLVAGVAGVGYAFMRARADRADAVARESLPSGAVTADEVADVFATNQIAAEEQYAHLGAAGHAMVGAVDRVVRDDKGFVWVIYRTRRGDLPARFKSTIGLAALTPGATAIAFCDKADVARDRAVLIGCVLDGAQ